MSDLVSIGQSNPHLGLTRTDVAKLIVSGSNPGKELSAEDLETAAREMIANRDKAGPIVEFAWPDGQIVLNRISRLEDGTLISVNVDVTKQKRAEQRLRGAIDSMDSPFVMFSAERKLVAWNGTFVKRNPEVAARCVVGMSM